MVDRAVPHPFLKANSTKILPEFTLFRVGRGFWQPPRSAPRTSDGLYAISLLTRRWQCLSPGPTSTCRCPAWRFDDDINQLSRRLLELDHATFAATRDSPSRLTVHPVGCRSLLRGLLSSRHGGSKQPPPRIPTFLCGGVDHRSRRWTIHHPNRSPDEVAWSTSPGRLIEASSTHTPRPAETLGATGAFDSTHPEPPLPHKGSARTITPPLPDTIPDAAFDCLDLEGEVAPLGSLS